MNKYLVIALLFIITSKGSAQLFIENFSYPQGIYLFQTGNWTNIGSPESPITVNAPGLSFQGYRGSGIGNLAALSDYGNSVYSLFSAVQTDGSVYASFMLRVLYPFTNGTYFFALRSSDGEQYAQVHIKEYDSPEFQLAITKSGQPVPHYTSPLFEVGETYLLVVKYKFLSGDNNDEVSLFVFDTSNPPPLSEPAPTVLPQTNAVPDAPNLDGVVLWQGNSQSALLLFVDGIYVYDEWFPEVALPVELTGFTSSVWGNTVALNWTTSTEINNSHFEIERSFNEEWTKAGSVQGSGTTSMPVSYSFTDKDLLPGTYEYRLKQIDFNGNFSYHNLANDVIVEVPDVFSLNQNYPNPFNPVTTIGYQIPFSGYVSIRVFDAKGKEMISLINEFQNPGFHKIDLDASELPSGAYIYRIDVQGSRGRLSDSKRMVLIK